MRMNMLGMFPFTAPYLAWVLLGFNVVMHSPLNADLVRSSLLTALDARRLLPNGFRVRSDENPCRRLEKSTVCFDWFVSNWVCILGSCCLYLLP